MYVVKRFPYFGSLALLAYMPFHIFLSQSLSLLTGGLDAWKVAKDLLLAILCMFVICLVIWQGKATKTFKILLGFSLIYGLFHGGVWLLNRDIYTESALLGTMYNMRLPLFLLLGYGSVLLLPKFAMSSVIKLLLVVSTLTAALGVIQYFLPHDILTHFGYSLERGARPSFTIDTNTDLARIMSTLREPNVLGAYLLLPLTAIATLFFRYRDTHRRIMLGGMFGIHALALFLTFSRSAWLGAVLAVGVVAWWYLKTPITAMLKRWWPALGALVLILGFAAYVSRDTHFFQQYILHSNPQEEVADLDSNDLHGLLLRQGLEGIADQPFGHGPGTAGLASIRNPDGGQLTENYYVQLGYEIGIPGLIVFVALNAWLIVRIWRRGDYITLVLCASFGAYVITNMFLHTWSNEAVAAQWWIVAGMSLLYNTRDD